MTVQMFRHSLPESLRPDARDGRLPRAPGAGFRNFLHAEEAPDFERWRGLGGAAETEEMLALVAHRMMATGGSAAQGPFPAGYTYLAQFAAHDMRFSTDEAEYPPCAVPEIPLRRRRLRLDLIYGDGPEREPALYGEGLDALAPWRLKLSRFSQRARSGFAEIVGGGSYAGALTPICAADSRNDENPVVAQIAGLLIRLHNFALRRLDRHGEGAERFEAARRVTGAVYRRILFGDLLARLLRDDVRARCATGPRIDPHAASTDDLPVEFTHVAFRTAHALVRADYAIGATVNGGDAINVRSMLRHTLHRDPDALAQEGGWPIDWSRFFGPSAQRAQPFEPHVNVFLAEAPGLLDDDYPRRRSAHLILRDLVRGMDSGPLTVSALAEALDSPLGGLEGREEWLLFDSSARGRTIVDWIGRDRALRPHLAALCEHPPLYLFLLIEAAAPAARGGGEGRRFGALGSALIAEPLFAALDATRAEIEDHPDLGADLAAVFGEPAEGGAPDDMSRLIAILTRPG